jgi:hypothetical protein
LAASFPEFLHYPEQYPKARARKTLNVLEVEDNPSGSRSDRRLEQLVAEVVRHRADMQARFSNSQNNNALLDPAFQVLVLWFKHDSLLSS